MSAQPTWCYGCNKNRTSAVPPMTLCRYCRRAAPPPPDLMPPSEVAAVLAAYNRWRRNGPEPQPHPLILGQALDQAIELINRLLPRR